MTEQEKIMEAQGHLAFFNLIAAKSINVEGLNGRLEYIEAKYRPHNVPQVVLILPGGGYEFTSFRESRQVALAFAQVGMDAFVLHYSCLDYNEALAKGGLEFKAVVDVALALNAIKSIAHFKESKVCVCGFSAGGHLAAFSTNLFSALKIYQNKKTKTQLKTHVQNVIEKLIPYLNLKLKHFKHSFSACILSYPVISSKQEIVHAPSFSVLSGSQDSATWQDYSAELLVDFYTPPTYIWHTQEDQIVSYQNSLVYAQAMWQHQAIGELNIFPQGIHGLSLSTKEVEPTHDFKYAIEHNAQWFMRAIAFINNYVYKNQ